MLYEKQYRLNKITYIKILFVKYFNPIKLLKVNCAKEKTVQSAIKIENKVTFFLINFKI